jgi:hypothetical protein
VPGFQVVFSGTRVICCVHDREKRKVNTPDDVAELGLLLEPPVLFDSRLHKIHRCACCDNLFIDPTDEPRFCSVCQRPLVHPLGGPLPDPIGVLT